MRYLFFSLLSIFILSQNSISAQEARIKWGPVEKIDKSRGYIEPLGWIDGKFYTFRQKTNNMLVTTFYLEVVDKNLNIQFSKQLDLKDYFSPVALLKEDKLLLYRLSVKETGVSSVGLHETVFDLKGNLLTDNLLTELEEVGRYNLNKVEQYLKISPNGEHLAVVVLKEELKDEKLQLTTIHVPTAQPDQYKSEIKMIEAVEDANDADLTQVFVDNNGNILSCLGSADRNFQTPSKSEPYEYVLYSWSPKGGYGEKQRLVFDGVYFDKIEIEKIDDQYFMTGMLLTRDKKRSQYNGFFLCKIDITTAKLSSINAFPYEIKFFESLGYRIKKDGRIDFNGKFLLNLVDTEAEGGYLIADHAIYDSYERSETKELIAIPFNSNGELGKQSVLLKHQVGMGKQMVNGVGYFTFSKGSTLYILYNDHLDNIEINELNELKYANRLDDRDVGAFMATIKEGTEPQRQILYKVKDKDDHYLLPKKCFEKDGHVILHIADGKKGRYGELILN